MIKNETVRITVNDITAEGAGVGRYEGMAVFVPHTAVGDVIDAKIVKINKNYAYGIIDKIITSSDTRIPVDCPSFYKCGGCVFRHINYKSELEIKENRVRETLKRIAGADIKSGGIVGADNTFAYRNKAQFPFSANGSTGFFAPRSHRVIPISECPLLPDEFGGIAACVSEFLRENNISVYNEESGRGLARHLYIRKGAVSGEIMVVLVINGDTLPRFKALTDKLLSLCGESLKSVQLNINKKRTNVILGDKNKVIFGAPYITDTLCKIKIRISPFTFYQINHDMAEKLYKKAGEYAEPKGKNIIDLYCGAGSIGLSLCDRAKSVTGVEIVPEAVEDAKENARINGIDNAGFICDDAKTAAKTLAERGVHADTVIIDPPRKGCEEELLHTIAEDFSPERIVYVSCDPATLARDIKILLSLGYTAEEFTAFDMFPRTGHVECVTLMTRKEAD
ncbi:MAG: 23S rRNA (uracil(1939)-C(5))-methyltransferase RlmD [Clostridia bacterium]|nr:23S rRNA (uracil(1939)-C(5))-methyltransferase RlmD [Clostridia bacterium]